MKSTLKFLEINNKNIYQFFFQGNEQNVDHELYNPESREIE